MKTNHLAAYLAGLTCLALSGVAQADETAQKDSKTPYQYNSEKKSDETSRTPGRFNRASSLIGMDVRNESGEKLGDIKDLVIDPETSKVSYAVMSSGGVLGVHEKLLAVPLDAFTRQEDKRCLILRATKENISQAESIGQNWPSVQEPAFGAAPFWQKPDQEPKTTPATPKPNDRYQNQSDQLR